MNSYEGLTLDGKYRLVRLLGKGGMGSVYMGQHVIIGKTVAVKFLHSEFATNEEVIKRFYREAQAAAAIAHDNIIDVMDVGISPNGEPFLVMEFLEGESLAELLDRTGPLDISASCGILEPVLTALCAAHAKGIVHRDLKPENIFLAYRPGEPPKVKIIDFGISKVTQGPGDKLTQTGSVMGTPAYMAPEQARGSSNLDHRADVYSAGVIFYEMLTGKLPFEGETFTELIISILTENPKPPCEIRSEIDPEVETALLKVLEKDPAKRFKDALDFLETMKHFPGFANRKERLISVASGATSTTYAAGDLGDSVSSSSGTAIAAEVLSKVASGATPTGWSQTRHSRRARRGLIVLAICLACALVVLGVAATVFILDQSEHKKLAPVAVIPVQPDRQSQPQAATQPGQASTTVTISIEGAPAGSRFFYDDMLVTQNPFKVQRGDAIEPLKVVAQGYEPYIVSIVPSQDREITVDLKPVESTPVKKERKRKKRTRADKPKEKSTSSSDSSTDAKRRSAGSDNPADTGDKGAKKLIKGARGTKIETEFD